MCLLVLFINLFCLIMLDTFFIIIIIIAIDEYIFNRSLVWDIAFGISIREYIDVLCSMSNQSIDYRLYR